MASLRELIIKISADSSVYRAEMQRATRMGENYYKSVESGSQRVSQSNQRHTAELRSLADQMRANRALAMSFTAAFTGGFAASSLVNTMDEWGQKAARIKIALESVEGSARAYEEVQERLLTVSNRNGKVIDESQELYISSAKAMQELGYNTGQTLDYIESLSAAFTANATQAEKVQSAMNALSRAQITGKLSGLEWKTVTAAMPTVIGDVARQLSVMRGGVKITEMEVKKLAAEGKISMQLFTDALISAKDANNELADSMDFTVSDSFNQVTNALKAYVGEANQSLGVTRTMSAALKSISENIGGIATAGGVAALVGLAKGVGALSSSIQYHTGRIADNKKKQIGLAAAQVNAAKTTQRKAEADTIAARSAYAVAQAEANVARGSNASMFATENLIAKRRRMIAENAKLVLANRAVAASEAGLKQATSVTTLLGNSWKGLISIVGGYPGILAAAATGLYFYSQSQQAARQSAIDYADTLETLKDKLDQLSKEQLGAEQGKAYRSIQAQTEAVKEQEEKVAGLESKYKDLAITAAKIREGSHADYGTYYNEKIFKSEADALVELKIATGELYDMKKKYRETQEAQGQIQSRLTHLYQTEIFSMESLNRQFAHYNTLLSQTIGLQNTLANSPLLSFTDAQQKELQRLEDAYQLLTRKGEDRVREQAQQRARELGLTGGGETRFVADSMRNYRQEEANRKADEAARKAEQSTKKAEGAAQQYQNAIGTLNRQLEIESIKLQEGERAAERYAAITNISAQYTGAQRDQLMALNETLITAKQRYEDYTAAISADPYRNADQARQKAEEQLDRQIAGGHIKSAEEIARRKEQIHNDYLSAILEADQRYAVSSQDLLAGNIDPLKGLENQLAQRQALIARAAKETLITEERKQQLMNASQREFRGQQLQEALKLYASQSDINALTVDLYQAASAGITNALTGLVTGSQNVGESLKNIFSSMAQSVIQSLIEMGMQAMMTKTIFSSLGIGSAAAAPSIVGMPFPFLLNAKGGIYNSPSLSEYSNQIVDRPTLFAFARGAGLMGEAGPEAIMPLKRASDGSLGVRVTSDGNGGQGVNQNISVTVNVSSDGDTEVDTQGAGEMGQALGEEIRRVCLKVLGGEMRQGGMIYTEMRNNRGR